MRLRGELDLCSAPTLTATLRRLRERDEDVLLDLDEVAFMDMSGLRAVVSAAREARRDGWTLLLTPGSPQVRRLISLVELEGQLPIEGSSG